MFKTRLTKLPSSSQALPGRDTPIQVLQSHSVLKKSLIPPFPAETQQILFGMGCFWGAERLFWQQPGVYVTAVGYAGGVTRNPSYHEVCTGYTGHTEVVRVVYFPTIISLGQLLKIFFESHDPTQGMRQGNDIGTQYRSAIYFDVGCEAQQDTEIIHHLLEVYQSRLHQCGLGEITTEFSLNQTFWIAEEEHQQYLAKNPNGYCGLKGTGVSCPE